MITAVRDMLAFFRSDPAVAERLAALDAQVAALTADRSAFEQQQRVDSAERARLVLQVRELTGDLSSAREKVSELTGYAEMLNEITKRQDSLLVSISSDQASTRELLTATIADKQHQAKLISALGSQITGQQVEIDQLRKELQVVTADLVAQRTQTQIEASKAHFLAKENDELRQTIATQAEELTALRAAAPAP